MVCEEGGGAEGEGDDRCRCMRRQTQNTAMTKAARNNKRNKTMADLSPCGDISRVLVEYAEGYATPPRFMSLGCLDLALFFLWQQF